MAVLGGGAIQVKGTVYRADKNNTLQDDLTSYITQGTATLDITQPVPWSFHATITTPSILTPYVDCLAPFLTLTYPDGSVKTGQMGLFLVMPSPASSTALITTGSVDARGLEWILSVDAVTDSYNVAAGIDYLTAVADVIKTTGITRYSLPPSGIVTPGPFTWKSGTSKITIINELLAGAGYYPLTSDRTGQLTSWLVPDLTTVAPAVTYTVAGGQVINTVDTQPLLDRFCNKVIVIADDAKRTAFVTILTNSNPANPTSTVALGITVVKVFQMPKAATSTQTLAMAHRLLDEGAAVYQQIKLRVLPDPTRDPREIIGVNLTDNNGNVVANANYSCQGMIQGFTTADAFLELTLNKIVSTR
jgi:hypothetical protein